MRRFESLVLCTAKNRRVTLQLALCTGGSSPQVNQLQIMWYYSTNLLKKNLHVSGPAQFKTMLFKGHLLPIT